MEQSVLDAIGAASNALDETSKQYQLGDLALFHECMTAALEDASEALITFLQRNHGKDKTWAGSMKSIGGMFLRSTK